MMVHLSWKNLLGIYREPVTDASGWKVSIYETYETSIEANNEKEAVSKAEKLPLEKWDDLQQTGGGDFEIDDVWEDDEDNNWNKKEL